MTREADKTVTEKATSEPVLWTDSVTMQQILFAPARAARPNAFGGDETEESCPFCPGSESQTPPELFRRGSEAGWDMRVFPNRYPVVSPPESGRIVSGVHEVIVETPSHELNIYDFSETRLRDLLEVYQGRWRKHAEDPRLQFLTVFRNHGSAAGQSLQHAHSQVVGFAFRPATRVDPVQSPSSTSEFSFASLGSFLAYCPEASISPYQIRITDREAGSFGAMSSRCLDTLASLLHRVVRALAEKLDRPHFNWYFSASPPSDERQWAMTIVPRLTTLGGLELASGLAVNIVRPHDAAAELRALVPRENETGN